MSAESPPHDYGAGITNEIALTGDADQLQMGKNECTPDFIETVVALHLA
jgi:hypothetical protein